jgi:hypothetical protein
LFLKYFPALPLAVFKSPPPQFSISGFVTTAVWLVRFDLIIFSHHHTMAYTTTVHNNLGRFGRNIDILANTLKSSINMVTCRVVRMTKPRVLVPMIWFISTLVTHSLLITLK